MLKNVSPIGRGVLIGNIVAIIAVIVVGLVAKPYLQIALTVWLTANVVVGGIYGIYKATLAFGKSKGYDE